MGWVAASRTTYKRGIEMGLIQGMVDGFIMTVGITPPSPENKRTATIFIATGIVGTIVGVAVLFVFILGPALSR